MKSYSRISSYSDSHWGISVDLISNVYVASWVKVGNYHDIWIRKYDSNGNTSE